MRVLTLMNISPAMAASCGIVSPSVRSHSGPAEFNVAAHGLRGIASILVLAAHIIGGTARHIYPQDADYVRLVEHPWYFGTFGVEMFFVISGFVILPSAMKYSLREFALRRVVRICPLFYVLSVLFVGLNLATDAYSNLNDPKTVAAGFLFVNLFTGTEQLTPNAWSLSYEMCFYALAALVVNFAVKRRSVPAGALAVMAAIAFVIAFPIAIYFLIGLLMRLIIRADSMATVGGRVLEMSSLAMLAWFASRAHFDYASWEQFSDPVVLPILLSISTYFYLALRDGSVTAQLLDNPVCRYVGNVSYSLYLVHPFPYFALRMLFVHYGLFTDDIAESMVFFSMVVFAASFLLAHIAHLALERWPYQKLFHQKVYRGSPEVAGAGA